MSPAGVAATQVDELLFREQAIPVLKPPKGKLIGSMGPPVPLWPEPTPPTFTPGGVKAIESSLRPTGSPKSGEFCPSPRGEARQMAQVTSESHARVVSPRGNAGGYRASEWRSSDRRSRQSMDNDHPPMPLSARLSRDGGRRPERSLSRDAAGSSGGSSVVLPPMPLSARGPNAAARSAPTTADSSHRGQGSDEPPRTTSAGSHRSGATSVPAHRPPPAPSVDPQQKAMERERKLALQQEKTLADLERKVAQMTEQRLLFEQKADQYLGPTFNSSTATNAAATAATAAATGAVTSTASSSSSTAPRPVPPSSASSRSVPAGGPRRPQPSGQRGPRGSPTNTHKSEDEICSPTSQALALSDDNFPGWSDQDEGEKDKPLGSAASALLSSLQEDQERWEAKTLNLKISSRPCSAGGEDQKPRDFSTTEDLDRLRAQALEVEEDSEVDEEEGLGELAGRQAEGEPDEEEEDLEARLRRLQAMEVEEESDDDGEGEDGEGEGRAQGSGASSPGLPAEVALPAEPASSSQREDGGLGSPETTQEPATSSGLAASQLPGTGEESLIAAALRAAGVEADSPEGAFEELLRRARRGAPDLDGPIYEEDEEMVEQSQEPVTGIAPASSKASRAGSKSSKAANWAAERLRRKRSGLAARTPTGSRAQTPVQA